MADRTATTVNTEKVNTENLADHTTTHRSHRIGDIVQLRVEKLLPFGVAGVLADGSRGIVREREIAWDKETQRRWRKLITPGQQCDVLVLDQRPDYWEMSLRLAEFDPWSTVADIYAISQLVEGVVTRFWNDAAVIELEPGVSGLLQQDELPEWATQPIDELLWVGDHVRAVITEINSLQRTMQLSMNTLSERRWQGYDIRPGIPTARRQVSSTCTQSQTTYLLLKSSDWGTNVILVIEDDAPQRDALCRWLRHENQQVYGAADAKQGFALFRQLPVDILICDLGLSSARDGIAILHKVMESNAEVQYILMTDWASAERHHEEITLLEEAGVLFLMKPFLPEELITVLATRRKQIHKPPPIDAQYQPAKKSVRLNTQREQRSSQKQLQQRLYHLQKTTRATKVMLFTLDTETRTVTIAAQSGFGRLNESGLDKLIYSPVRDVAEDGISIQIEDAQKQHAYVRHLRPLLRFRSLVGVPVAAKQRLRYALLLFHTTVGFGGHVVHEEAQATAMQISSLLEKQSILEEMAEMQHTVLLGHLSRALIHETNNQLNPILFSLSDLERQHGKVQRALELRLPTLQEQFHKAHQMLGHLNGDIYKLVKTTRMFGRVTIQDQEDLVRVDKVAEECLELVRDLAERAKITLHSQPPPSPLITEAKFTQVQQVLLNLLLNAVQQLATTRNNRGGTIYLWFAVEPADGGIEAIRVFIEDDGPGIHRRLHERIFELGMTTRRGEGGSGMGLFVSQRLIESAGGYLAVDESICLWGTRMVAEFPIYVRD